MARNNRIVIGISGASGAIYAQRLIRLLVSAGIETHLVASPTGQRMLHDELGMEGLNLDALAGTDPQPDEKDDHHRLTAANGLLRLHSYRDVGSVIASGSFLHDGMVIVPCSSNTLSAVAHGSAGNLLHRAAAVTLKERRRLVLLHREMPISLADARNMQLAIEAGAVVCPASPGFYMLPGGIDDLVDFVAGRVLDLVGVEHTLKVRWGQDPAKSAAKPPATTY